jgi:single-stranded-DNA-specific exonuclease
MEVAAVRAGTINARTLGFALGPRINAVGRLDAAEQALRLLLTDDAAEAQRLAERLDRFNRERQTEQERIYGEAVRQAQNFTHDRILVLASARWHPGVIGNVASRMVEAHARPAILISLNEETATGRGSARSIPGFHMLDALTACGSLFGRFGGHSGAAGFDIEPARVEDLRAVLRAHAEETLPLEMLQPAIQVDAELDASALSLDVARDLAKLEPFGIENPKPVFLTRRLTVTRQLRLASQRKGGGDHLKLLFEGPNRRPLEGVFWRSWPRAEQAPAGAALDVCYELELNHFGGAYNLQLTLCDFRPAV